MNSARSIILNDRTTSNGRLSSTTNGTAVAVCGIGLNLLNGSMRDMSGLWSLLLPKDAEQEDATEKYIAMGKKTSDVEKLGNTERDSDYTSASLGSSSSSNSAKGNETVTQKLIEVAFQALEDGAEVDYRGEKACVGLYIGAADSELEMHETTRENSELSEVLLQVSQYHDLQGPKLVARCVLERPQRCRR